MNFPDIPLSSPGTTYIGGDDVNVLAKGVAEHFQKGPDRRCYGSGKVARQMLASTEFCGVVLADGQIPDSQLGSERPCFRVDAVREPLTGQWVVGPAALPGTPPLAVPPVAGADAPVVEVKAPGPVLEWNSQRHRDYLLRLQAGEQGSDEEYERAMEWTGLMDAVGLPAAAAAEEPSAPVAADHAPEPAEDTAGLSM